MTDDPFELSDEDKRLLELEAYAMMATTAFRPSPPKQPSHPVQMKPDGCCPHGWPEGWHTSCPRCTGRFPEKVGLYVFAGGMFATGILISVILGGVLRQMKRKRKTDHDATGNTKNNRNTRMDETR